MLLDLGDPAGRSAWTVTADDGREFAAFALDDGSLRVSDAHCPHRRGPLIEGRVRDGEVRCPWHWYRFDLDHRRVPHHGSAPAGVHPVLMVDGRPHADVGEAPPEQLSWSERLRAHARDGT